MRRRHQWTEGGWLSVAHLRATATPYPSPGWHPTLSDPVEIEYEGRTFSICKPLAAEYGEGPPLMVRRVDRHTAYITDEEGNRYSQLMRIHDAISLLNELYKLEDTPQ
jgi:hypothetical protein